MEPFPVFLDYVRQVAGGSYADDYLALKSHDETPRVIGVLPQGLGAFDAGQDDRMRKRIFKNIGYSISTTVDKATAMLPALMAERLPELGMDFVIVYPSLGQEITYVAPHDLRRALARAYNTMTADMFAGTQARLAPVAAIPSQTPEEAAAEAEHAVRELGFKVIMIHGALPRPVPASTDGTFGTSFRQASYRVPYYIDTLGLDSQYDYTPLWEKCVELEVAVTSHGGAHAWVDRRSVSNLTFNHAGHFAQANQAFCKSVFLGGLTRRYPNLNFAFLEGGIGYAVNLLCDLLEHWSKLRGDFVREYYNPAKTDFDELRALLERYGSEAVRTRLDDILGGLPKKTVEPFDDFAATGVASKDDIAAQFSRAFYFGCEADDRVTAWAFDKRMPARLKPVFSSDLSHWDSPVMEGVIPEACELVEDGYLTEQDFREFTFSNAVRLHGSMSPRFFEGTSIESEAAKELALAS